MTTPAEPLEAAGAAHWSVCDFCGAPVAFRRFEIAGGPFWGLEAMHEGAGSDHLATWCADCGPQHRSLT